MFVREAVMSCNDEFYDSELDAEIDLTSLIDVVFMLLIFFVVASNFIKPAMEILLPESKSAQAPAAADQDVCVITVTRTGDVLCGGEQIPPEGIGRLIEENSDKVLNLFIDRDAPFLPVLTIMDEAKLRQHEKIIFTVNKKNAGS